ncbi:MAG: DUF465 domain-containing protein [Deltaproteobacteria bacterium]|nr:DUF465 domain-containing protein [Deltaproteobacteria bacterium]
MENQDQELVKKLLEEDEEFKKTFKTHKDYETKLARLEKKPRLTSTETLEKNNLKKLKLALKDEMEKKISRYRKGA